MFLRGRRGRTVQRNHLIQPYGRHSLDQYAHTKLWQSACFSDGKRDRATVSELFTLTEFIGLDLLSNSCEKTENIPYTQSILMKDRYMYMVSGNFSSPW